MKLRTYPTVLVLTLCSVAFSAHAQVSMALNYSGLSAFNWNGVNMLGDGNPNLESVGVCAVPGVAVPAAAWATDRSVDANNGVVNQSYAWGSIRTTYRSLGDRLAISVQVANHGLLPICQLVFTPLHVAFPQQPPELASTNPQMAHNSGLPSIVPFSFGSGVMAVVNEDVVKPLSIGLPWNDPPLGYPLKISIGRNPMYPASYPYIDRPIPPGGSDEYDLTLRFGPPGSTGDTLAGDMYPKYGAAHPALINWPDRRPFGDVFMAALWARSGSNPRGYFGDPSIDVFSPAGLADFHNRVIALADRTVSQLQSLNAQGVIVWDLEGQEHQEAVYVGDPLQLPAFAPEMNTYADEFFARIRNAGFKIGVCVRMQQATFMPGGGVAQVQLSPDQSVQRLVNRIQYAQNRWGASVFYVDSNDYFDSDIFRQVITAVPGILLIPEHGQVMHFAYGAPYIDARFAEPCTPDLARKMYPQAFNIVNFVDLGTFYAQYPRAKQCGETMLFRGDYADGESMR